MSVELIGNGGAGRVVLHQMPSLLGPAAIDENRNEDADSSYLCLISQVDDQLVVWDLGGKSGTFVNGSRIKRATLKDSDTLGFGGSEFRVRSDPRPGRYMRGVRN